MSNSAKMTPSANGKLPAVAGDTGSNTVGVKERPILFNGPMVLALLAGTKTQTRRIVKDRQIGGAWPPTRLWQWDAESAAKGVGRLCPYGVVGDRLWVRETFAIAHRNTWAAPRTLRPTSDEAAFFAAGWDRSRPSRWRPSIFMPRWACRIVLEVTGVRVERIQEITDDDARAEGVVPYQHLWLDHPVHGPGFDGVLLRDQPHRLPYADLWNKINGPMSWAKNPWVWVITFGRVNG